MISQREMQRQIIAFAFEETRNRALEEAAITLERLPSQMPPSTAAKFIRSLKRDPSLKMTDWWADDPPQIAEAALSEKEG